VYRHRRVCDQQRQLWRRAVHHLHEQRWSCADVYRHRRVRDQQRQLWQHPVLDLYEQPCRCADVCRHRRVRDQQRQLWQHPVLDLYEQPCRCADVCRHRRVRDQQRQLWQRRVHEQRWRTADLRALVPVPVGQDLHSDQVRPFEPLPIPEGAIRLPAPRLHVLGFVVRPRRA